MKKYILFTLLLSGCAVMDARPTNTLTNAMVKEGTQFKFEPVESKTYGTENSDLKISYEPTIIDAGVNFKLENKTAETMKIIWDETVFIFPGGQSQKVFHNGVKIADRSASQPPTIVVPKGNHSDQMVPNDKVFFGGGAGSYDWNYFPLCGTINMMVYDDDSECVGKTFGFLLTYEVNGKKKTVTGKYKYTGKTLTTAQTNSK